MVREGDLKLFAGSANLDLAEKISSYLGVPLGRMKRNRFSDGEFYVKYEESVRGVDAYVIQPTCPPADVNIMELNSISCVTKRRNDNGSHSSNISFIFLVFFHPYAYAHIRI